MIEQKTTWRGRRVGVNEQKRKQQRKEKFKSSASRLVRWFLHRGWIVCGILIVLGVVGYQNRFFLQRFNPLELLNLRTVEIEGNRMLSWDDVLQNARVETGMSFFDVNEDSVQQALLHLPLIREVEVKKSFPSKLKIKLVETSAVLSVLEGSNIVAYSEKGLPMTIARASAMRLPVLSIESMDKIKETASFLTTMRQISPALFEKVSQIEWSEKNRAFEVFFKDAGYHVLFPASDWNKDLFALYESLGNGFNGDLKCAGEVDMRFPGFAYVRKYEKRCING